MTLSDHNGESILDSSDNETDPHAPPSADDDARNNERMAKVGKSFGIGVNATMHGYLTPGNPASSLLVLPPKLYASLEKEIF